MADNFSSQILRGDLGGALIPDEISQEIIQTLPQSSVLLTRARRVPMSSKKKTQPVLASLPEAYWVSEGGLKQTSKTGWEDVQITAEELAVIVPIPDSVVDDAKINLWDTVKPLIAEAMGKKIDQAGIFGVDKPSTWGNDILAGATAAGTNVASGTGVDLADDIAMIGQKLSEKGFAVNGFASQPGLNWQLARLRDANGQPIYTPSVAAGDATLAFGLPRGAKGDKGDPGDAGQVATATVAGVVKPGDNLSVRADGTLDAAAAQYELPVASDTTLGGVKVSKVDYTDARTFPVVVCDGEKLGLSFKLGDNAMPDGIEFHGTENTTIGLKKATQDALGIVRGGGKGIHVAVDGTLNLDLPAATAGAIGGVKPDGKTITAAADGTITAVAQTGPVEYRELVGYENAAQGYAVRVSDRTWLCCFNSFAMQTDGTTRLPYFYAFLRQAGSSSLTALVANPFDTNGITLLSTDGEQMRFSYGGGGRWAGARAVSGLDAATLILTEA